MKRCWDWEGTHFSVNATLPCCLEQSGHGVRVKAQLARLAFHPQLLARQRGSGRQQGRGGRGWV